MNINIDISTEIDLIKTINKWNEVYSSCTFDERLLMIANEVNSVHIYNCTYKLIPITTKGYIDSHYSFNNKYYDIFKIEREGINYDNMYQIILCDNYAEILKFPQDKYEDRKYVSRFSLLDPHIYTFYDDSIIIIETKDGRSEEPYMYL